MFLLIVKISALVLVAENYVSLYLQSSIIKRRNILSKSSK